MVPMELVAGCGTVLLGIVGYFLKKTHDKVDATAIAVTAMGISVENKIDALEIKLEAETKSTKKEIIQIFQDICHERQISCGKLRDAMLNAVDHKSTLACSKVAKIVEDRDRKWEKQENFNEQIKRVLYQTKDGGKSWQLKEQNGI